MTNKELFTAQLEKEYSDLFLNNSEYAFAASRTTPQALAQKMTESLANNTANKDGEAIKRACKSFGIKHTYAAIKEFLNK